MTVSVYKVQKFEWEKTLIKLQHIYLNSFNSSSDKGFDENFETCFIVMQQLFPGNYTLGWRYDLEKGLLVLHLKFKDPKDETFWKLKNSYE